MFPNAGYNWVLCIYCDTGDRQRFERNRPRDQGGGDGPVRHAGISEQKGMETHVGCGQWMDETQNATRRKHVRYST